MLYKNKKYKLLVILFILGNLFCQAQYQSVEDFIPNGYVLYDTIYGDLNKDKLDDCILIVKETYKENIVTNRFDEIVDRNRRGIIILFKNENGYQKATENLNCFSSENEDGGAYYPPQLSFDVKRGNLIIHYAHGRYGWWKYTFRYQDSNFKLIGYDHTNGGVVTNYETSINFLTKKKLYRKNINEESEDNDEVFVDTWSKIKIDKLLNLSEIKDFEELEMNY
ncbi:hypothetical protein [Flavobacterium okayamense]|uniref:Uncharacterized protein n=1 Tax=Flavobacterium okayamense TaxID=2830782 RepID=A0ABN6I1G3_9FLAO|nr:hypothetical protein [Flavobacterium okayamense]BCY28946.1 hypothetical protein KK2020170_18140 [Flavobacterium okayamense]